MLHPTRHRENILRFEKTPRRCFPKFFLRHLGCLVGKQVEFRQALIASLFAGLKRNRPLPFVRAHNQQLLRPEWHQRDLLEEVDVSLAADCCLFRHSIKFAIQPIMK